MIIVDTGVWIDAFRGKVNPATVWLDANLEVSRIGILDLSICEILQGSLSEGEFSTTAHYLAAFENFSPHGFKFAADAAYHYFLLRRRGITVRSMVDCMIATFCIQNGHKLLHNDRDFDPFEEHLGLKVLHV